MIRVVLADDQAIVRAGIARILAPADGFEVVAECADGTEVAAEVVRTRPDVVVMDVRMPRRDGLAATREVRALPEPPPVLILTTFDEDEVLWSALEAGAAGFLLKDAGATDLIHAVRAVAGGAAWFDPAVSTRVLAAYRRSVVPGQRQRRRLEELTERETEVLRWMARGATNAEIAAGLHVSDGTVKSHVGAVFGKLGVRDRAAAIVYAFDHGVVSAGQGPPAP
ncbi:response regulator transcription factor [Occultella glacieicola]|uniref:Response regulator transcription factor n=1 Tax=Occultella glacieicola TaxID=2518684 RepID=A0ABY2DY21_9MICO|nr:response regulator transcription factor [Occultella glacieicola]TDE88573.1 response regulator transcription factor [Occultella glacieicola]